MVNSEILGGLKIAVSKGDSLKQAMRSFFNAGYKREEIEEAARVLQQEKVKTEKPEPEPKKNIAVKKKIIPKKPSQKISAYETSEKKSILPKKNFSLFKKKETSEKKKEPEKKPVQKVSDYDKKPKPKILIFLLIFFLLILIGAITAIFLFQNELVDFLNKIS